MTNNFDSIAEEVHLRDYIRILAKRKWLVITAFVLIASGLTGYISSVRNLTAKAEDWIAGGAPLTMMMNVERRHGSQKPVIKKALVDLKGAPFTAFASKRAEWAVKTSFRAPGAIQYYGPAEICDATTLTIRLEHAGRTR